MSGSVQFEVYFDFDNTITEFDVLDDLIRRFSINEDWREVERAWEREEIGSRECLERQLSQVRITESALRDYLKTVPVDPSFGPIVELLRKKGVEPVILSDCFSSIIGTVMENHGLAGIRIVANEMRLVNDTPAPSFPYFGAICMRCGNCKTSHLFRRDRPADTRKIYVGDGASDFCPAGFCEILFAKGSLLKHYAPRRPDCIPFERLDTVYRHLSNILP